MINFLMLTIALSHITVVIGIIFGMGLFAEKIKNEKFKINSELSIDVEDINKNFDTMLNQIFADFLMLNPKYMTIQYYNSEEETDLHKTFVEYVSNRLSPILIEKLFLVYDATNINDIIAEKCYIIITDFVVKANTPKL
mgnify:CR=1 FL=1